MTNYNLHKLPSLTNALIVIMIVIICVGIPNSANATDKKQPGNDMENSIDRNRAEELALNHYNKIFVGLSFTNRVDGDNYKFPELKPGSFRATGEIGNYWIVVYEPLAGPQLIMKVSKIDEFIQIEKVQISTE